MYHVRISADLKCPIHKWFNPALGAGKIKGNRVGCRCWDLCKLEHDVIVMERKLREFGDAPARRDDTRMVERIPA